MREEEECKVIQEDRARKMQVEIEKAKSDLISETGRINQEIAELNAEIAAKGESGLQTKKKAQLEIAHEHATTKFQEVRDFSPQRPSVQYLNVKPRSKLFKLRLKWGKKN